MAGFEELGLHDELVARAREQGFDAPSALQRSIIPVIRRGGNAIVSASSGSGVTAAYALALIDRFGGETGTRALVIVPTADRAERVANTIARFARGSQARVGALTDAWSAAHEATIVVASAERLLSALEDSQLKLEGIEAVVVDNADAIVNLNGAQPLETIFASLPREGQRIFISGEFSEPVRKLADAHARKALTFPPRPAVAEREQHAEPTLALRYVVASAEKKTDVIARFARAGNSPVTLLCRSTAAATRAEQELRSRGFEVSSATYDAFDASGAQGMRVGYDPPFSAEQLTDCFRAGDTIVCERHELPHLRAIAADANVKLSAATPPKYEADSLNSFRNEIRRAAREEDLEAQMLVLEPLLQ
ncbi:MAG TPA: DEAD/DEAH box helicase, partial [Longimicrobiales bacterium]